MVIIWREGAVCLKLDIQGQEGGKIFDVARQGGGGYWKWDNFHGCHMCIIPNIKIELYNKIKKYIYNIHIEM